MMSWTIHRQPHFKSQKPNETIVWIYGLYSDTEGNYIKKRIVDCTGEELSDGRNDDGVVGSWRGSGVACRVGVGRKG